MEKFVENGKVKIFVREAVAPNSETAVLLIHGLAEHSGRYEEFMKSLQESGVSVFAMDLRGHGQTVSKKGDSESIKKVLSDVRCVVDYIKTNFDVKRFGLFGHSAGGLVSVLFASLYPQETDFLVLSSPAVYCPKKMRIIKFVPYKILPFVKLEKKHSESKQMLEYSKKDPYALHKFSIRTIGVFLDEGQKLLKKKMNVSCPVLLVCGKKDILLSEQEKFVSFMEKCPNKKNKFVCYEDAKHRIVQNEGSQARIADIIKWIKFGEKSRKFAESIETKDLILGKAKPSDLESIYKNFWSQEDTARYMLWTPCKTIEEAKARLERSIEVQKGHLRFFVYEKKTGQAIGVAGMEEIEPDVFEDGGIGIGRDFVGKGYGKQILKALIDYCFDELGAKKIVCSCDSRNIPSAKLQQSCGMKYSHSENKVKKRDGEKFVADFYVIEK